MFLFIDDERDPEFLGEKLGEIVCEHGEPVVARTVEECFEKTAGKVATFISFDHDLGQDSEGNNRDSVEFLVPFLTMCLENGFRIPEYFVHSQNPAGRERIVSWMESAYKVESNS